MCYLNKPLSTEQNQFVKGNLCCKGITAGNSEEMSLPDNTMSACLTLSFKI